MRTILVSVLAVALLSTPLAAQAGKPGGGGGSGLPNSIASTGDSITRAMDVCCFPGFDYPAYSWSTGDGSGDGITSHYEHILAKNSLVKGKNYNDAKSGAKMIDLQGQVHAAATQGAQYITILMGANDLCTSSAATMTPTATFQAQFQAAIDDIKANDPSATVYVLSIPNIYQLWQLEHTNAQAYGTWASFNICQSMLYEGNTEADRQLVVSHEFELNGVLASLTLQAGANFHWDGNATYNYQFRDSEVSHLDYFHPSAAGQATLATLSWKAGPYASLA